MTETAFDAAAMDRLPADYEQFPQVFWAPVRHHSPHCAWQLRRLIDCVRPDVVLIEGPEEGNGLLPFLLDEATRPPVAFFIYCHGSAVQRRCFVPLAAMSPEWVALREAKRLGIAVRFIDLPFMTRHRHESSSDNADVLEPLLNDDQLLARADAMAILLATSGCADFDSWWERHFESGVAYASAEQFFARVLNLGEYLRAGSVLDAQTLAREAHMAACIDQARSQGQRCLVVCGAFHCAGILKQLGQGGVPAKPGEVAGGVHLINYSLSRLNASAQYAAGIPDCAYQARVWSTLARRRENPGDVHGETHAAMAAELVNYLRERRFAASLPDAIEAVTLARRLAALRGHGTGRLELREALLSSLHKHSLDGSERPLLAHLDAFFAGDEVGRLPAGLPVPPLVEDFRQTCRRLRLPRSAAQPLERALDIYRSPLHREQSRFLHRLASLDAGYGKCVAGPRFASGEDLARVREVWVIRWQPEIEATLTEKGHYGARLLDAATARCLERLNACRQQGAAPVAILIDALAMGLHALLGTIVNQVRHWLAHESDLTSLCLGLLRLDAARHAKVVLGGEGLEALDELLAECFQRICLCLPWVGGLSEEHQEALADALVGMLNLLALQTPGCEPASFFEALQLLLAMQPSPLLSGLAQGVLLEAGHLGCKEVVAAYTEAAGYAERDASAPGQFIAGLLRVARHRFLQQPALQQGISDSLQRWDEDTFLRVLPGLRLAFTRLSPRQLSTLGGLLFGGPAAALQAGGRHWSVADLHAAAELRETLASARQVWDGGARG
ncbi:DUF5682 family protein [Pseudomonas turukhanskensis]|uniref:Uncharacterized protein n=1 Tax=Pseudomonas turukhanskensis TaxID=1806536 RepID=A0A9W6K8W8_9PSED|nr:DUF5682 family protein [Pseudomonas turukhanskensis]GLK89629.1 hypothetical protein GCM10017655_26910 [Pseudomonas turukhanskensis]